MPAQSFPWLLHPASLSSNLEPFIAWTTDSKNTVHLHTRLCKKSISIFIAFFVFFLFVWQENSVRWIYLYSRYIWASNCQQKDKIQTCHLVCMTVAPWPTKHFFFFAAPQYSSSTKFWNGSLIMRKISPVFFILLLFFGSNCDPPIINHPTIFSLFVKMTHDGHKKSQTFKPDLGRFWVKETLIAQIFSKNKVKKIK